MLALKVTLCWRSPKYRKFFRFRRMGPILEATFRGWGYIPRSRGNFYILSKPSSGQDSSPKLCRFIPIWSVQSFSMKHHAVSWFARPRNNGPFSCYNLILGNIFIVPSLGRWTKKMFCIIQVIVAVSIFDRELRPRKSFVCSSTQEFFVWKWFKLLGILSKMKKEK